MLVIQFKHKTCSINEQTVHLTKLNEMYPKFKCSCRVELSFGNEHLFYSRRVYFSADSNSTYKTFLCSSIKRKTNKDPEFQRYCNICNNNIYAMRFLYNRQPCLFMDRQKITYLIFTGFFVSYQTCFLCIKNDIVENKSVNF